jgi:hypothetical protein
MSSWSKNIMEVTASEADLLKLKALFAKGFSLEAIKPMPPELANNGRWGEWRCENWGTNRDVYEQDEGKDPFKPKMTFWTNYTPPLEALEELTRQFPDISINLNWYNRECLEAGQYHIAKGITAGGATDKYEEVKKLAKEIHGDDWDEDEE